MTQSNWNDLLEAFAETVLAVGVLVTLFSMGVRGLAKHTDAAEGEGENVGASEAGAVLCFVLSLAIVAYGVYLIATK
jgi:hypothetical protein